MDKPHLRVADVFRAGFTAYCAGHGPLPPQHYRVANALMACRSAALGGHVLRCDRCGHHAISYNSCRNRHCPTCQAQARARWVQRRSEELLPVPYFHVVFTLPAQLNPFALRNKAVFYDLLFKAASRTLSELGEDPKWLGAQMGFIAVLHTWGQNLCDHPHLHCIVPGGGLDEDRWVEGVGKEFLFPVKVLSALFRGKFLAMLREAIEREVLLLHGELAHYRLYPRRLSELFDTLYRSEWVVYAKPPFAGPQAVVKYLGRYTHRIAIANSRLVRIDDTHVTFTWKDYRCGNAVKEMTLTHGEFIRRFLLHVVPKGFVRIRYYGFLSPRARGEKLPLCMSLTGKEPPAPVDEATEPAQECLPKCPLCEQGHLVRRRELPREWVRRGYAATG